MDAGCIDLILRKLDNINVHLSAFDLEVNFRKISAPTTHKMVIYM